jgi:TonB-linked SusC/RagA family outer membrane protein
MEKLLRTFLVCIFFVCANCMLLFAQQKVIKGTVTDDKGAALPGVTVKVKGGTGGTQTGTDGKYSIGVSGPNPVLAFSFVGFAPQELTVTSTELNVSLVEQPGNLNEVVVVGFGQEKRANLTGAIGTITGKDLVATSVSNLSTALIGATPGIGGLQSSGEPGRNQTSIYIRGQGTYGNSNALVVIDGVEQASERSTDELNSMDANEIESITLLKDAASTAVYGIRGANGVIVITTKRGKIGKPSISLTTNFGATRATNLQKGTNSYEYAVMRNEAVNTEVNTFGNAADAPWLFSANDLWKFANNRDFTPTEVAAYPGLTDAQRTQLNNSPAVYYGSHDLYAEQFANTGGQEQLNLSIRGGTEKVKYFTSLGYFQQGTILTNTSYGGANDASNFNRYNFRSNFDIKATKDLTFIINLSGQFGTTVGPGTGAGPYDQGGRYKIIEQYIYDGNPINTQGILNGHLTNNINGVAGSFANPLGLKLNNNSVVGSQNAVYNLLTAGIGTINSTLLDNSIKAVYNLDDLVKGLSVHGLASYQDNYTKYVTQNIAFPTYTFQRDAVNPNTIDFYGGAYGASAFNAAAGNNSTWKRTYFDAGFDYNRTFGPHAVTALIYGKAQVYSLPTDNYNSPSGLTGLVGRTTYNFKSRYNFEFDVNYSGTEQFAPGKRYGFFPAFSGAWTPTNETFFKPGKWLTYLKIRGSYGVIGNDQLNFGGVIRRYLYLPNSYSLGLTTPNNNQGYYFGNSNGTTPNPYYGGAAEGAIGNPDVTWERKRSANIGMDAKFINDKLNLTVDVFKEDRSNILTILSTIPVTYGVSSSNVPPVNVGITTNKGYEVSLGWNDHVGAIGYSATGSVAYAINKIIYQAEPPNPYPWMNRTGYPINQKFGLITDGFYNTLDELASRPYNTFNSNQTTLGDIRYKDLNGDGKIDNKDVAPIGYPNLPQYNFSLKLGLTYKGFDLSALFTGTANGTYYLSQTITQAFNKGIGNVFQWEYDGRWTAAKAAAGVPITYPRASIATQTGTTNFSQPSDLWAISNSYKRLKNVELGYTIPNNNFFRKAGISNIRVYANSNNLFTWDSALSKMGIDAESTDGGSYVYPLTRAVIFGANVRF